MYREIINHPIVIRVVALSGGYSTKEENQKLKENDGLIDSFSRPPTQEFNASLENAVASIYDSNYLIHYI